MKRRKLRWVFCTTKQHWQEMLKVLLREVNTIETVFPIGANIIR